MNSFYEYFAAQQKLAAYRQAKRMQRGVKLGFEQNVSSSYTTKFVSTPIPIGTSDFSIEFYGNTYGSKTYTQSAVANKSQLTLYEKGSLFIYQAESDLGGISWILFEKPTTGYDTDDSINLDYTPSDPFEKFLLTITRQGTTVKVYINGELKATKEQSEVKDLGDLQLVIANSSDVGFVRGWNMCLSDGDITAHYNNGDPMGYVVPKAMRDLSPIQITGVNTYTWTGTDDVTEFRVTSSPRLQYLHKYRVNISVSDYQSGTPYLYAGSVVAIPASNGTYDVELEVSDAQYIFLTMYGGRPGSDRRLTLTVNSIAPVGLLAEYLPQNLMYGRDDKAIATSWLDSAKQLPLSDESMEPLFQSIGGYDMTANGAPEIIYNE